MTDQKKIALVTGGNKGIGLAVVKSLAEKGMTVIATSRDVAAGKAAVSGLDGDIDVVQLDVTDAAGVITLKDYVQTTYGRLDILVNNAGIALDLWRSGLEADIDEVRQTFETNVIGVLRCTQAFLPMMQAAKYGRIVNVSSEIGSLGEMSMPGSLAYRISKTALNAVTRLLALEMQGGVDIKINAACPGWVKTDLGGHDAPRSPAEGADTITWLALLDSDGPNGEYFRDRIPYPW